MKKVYLILLATLALVSCNDGADNKPTFPVAVDVQSSFDQDQVQIFIDGKKRFDEVLQTNYVLGVCLGDGQFVTDLSGGKHSLKVVVNNSVTKTESFAVDKNLFIGVNFDPQLESISLTFSDQMFGYD